MPGMINIPELMEKYAGAFNVPATQDLTLPAAPQRAALQFADPTKMVGQMNALKPTNPQLGQAEFEQKRFADGLAAAALASTQADGLGSVLAAAGGAFGQAASGANEDRKQEALAFEDRNRAFEASMAQLQWDVDQAEAEQTNATSDLDFENASGRAAQAREQLQINLQQQEAHRSALAQKLGMELDMMQFGAQQETTRAQITAQNQDRQRAHQQKYEPQWSISEDGSMMTQTYLDPATNKMVVHQEPVGIMGQLQQMSQLAATIPNGLGNEMMGKAVYDNMARIAPQMMKRKLIMDTLNTPGGENVFDPDNSQSTGLFDVLSYPGYVADKFTESPVETVSNAARKFVDKQVEAGLLTREQAVNEFQIRVAQALEPYMTPQVVARMKKLNNPDITHGLGLVK